VDFGEKMLVSRVMINTSTVHGAIGLSTALSLSLTLGWGSWGGNVTSPNISLLHLMNIKRVAFGITAPCKYDFNYIPTVCSADKF
jgi:acetaldehyde dehydrogenase (acetylating)